MSRHVIVSDESIIVGIFSDKEVHDLYQMFVEKISRKLRDMGIDVVERDINPRATIYIRNGSSHKYYIGLEIGVTLAREEFDRIMNALLEIFKELGLEIEHIHYETLELGKEYFNTIPLYNLMTLHPKDIRKFDECIRRLK